ncbi:MAG: hypothetical protein JEZ11_14900 [Desulfobacterales bacterium]|nr:hypothetical protein [Desulfobacterales bacterium]
MYLARKTIHNRICYFIRDSYLDGDTLKSRDVFNLGGDPGRHIVYPGGNGYYYDDEVVAAVEKCELDPGSDDLDRVFWDFLDPRIRRVIKGFQRPGKAAPVAAEPDLFPHIHHFDKRRLHFLKFGDVDPGNIESLSPKMTRVLYHKSRDEIEQYFAAEERILKPTELRTYVFAIFDLQRHFTERFARQFPQGLSVEKMDACFVRDICRLNENEAFWKGMERAGGLEEYLRKYVIMHFDSEFPSGSPMGDYLRDFMNARRAHRWPAPRPVDMDAASELFGVSRQELQAMGRRRLTRLYRNLALRHHPDKGGDGALFGRLTESYQGLLKRKKR